MTGTVHADLGPVTPARAAVYAQAAEIHALARLAVEFTLPGGQVDVPRALRQFERIREVLGVQAGD